MGKKSKTIRRVVLDTNVLVSALLFKGRLSRIVRLWHEGRIIPIISRETFDELRTVLQYPGFSFSREDIRAIVEEEILPFFEVVQEKRAIQGICRDPDDDKFLSCAVSGRADCIVSGDQDILDLGRYPSIKIIRASEFIKMFD